MRRAVWIAVAGAVAAAIVVFAWPADEAPTREPAPSPPPRAVLEPQLQPVESIDAAVLSAPAAAGPTEAFAPAPADAPAPTPAAETPSALTTLTTQLELDAGFVGTPLDAGRKRTRDKRFGVRWDDPGLCDDEPLVKLAQRRAALLASFATVRRADTLIHLDPELPVAVADAVGESLLVARRTLAVLLGARADVPFPEIYVYQSADQLRSVACVNVATQGYYDGAIHLPANDPDAHRTVVHELTHHVLRALGVQKPMWFHEGLAMYAANERWWEDPRSGLVPWLQREHLPFAAMTDAFPHTADELFAGAVYFQSYEMVRFLGAKAGKPDFAWFAEGLSNGSLDPQTAFGASLNLDDASLEREWQRFVLTPP